MIPGSLAMMASAAVSSDPYFSSVVLLAINDNKGDATTVFADQSSYYRTLTTVGNAQYDTAQAPTGMTSSGLFDGSGDIVEAAYAAELQMGGGDFTIEFFFRAPSLADNFFVVYKDNNTGVCIYKSPNYLAWYASSNGTSWDIASDKRFTAPGGLAANTWYHVALDRTGSTFRPYFNGVLGPGTVTSSATLHNSGSGSFKLGENTCNGWISNIRITKGVGRYPSTCSVPSLPLPTATT